MTELPNEFYCVSQTTDFLFHEVTVIMVLYKVPVLRIKRKEEEDKMQVDEEHIPEQQCEGCIIALWHMVTSGNSCLECN